MRATAARRWQTPIRPIPMKTGKGISATRTATATRNSMTPITVPTQPIRNRRIPMATDKGTPATMIRTVTISPTPRTTVLSSPTPTRARAYRRRSPQHLLLHHHHLLLCHHHRLHLRPPRLGDVPWSRCQTRVVESPGELALDNLFSLKTTSEERILPGISLGPIGMWGLIFDRATWSLTFYFVMDGKIINGLHFTGEVL